MNDINYFDRQVIVLQGILDIYAQQQQRVCAVGTTCIGKSYLLEHLRGVSDMDKLLFPLLSEQEQAYVCQKPWTKEIGENMTRLAKERIQIRPGNAVFGTVVLNCDRLIHLRISDTLLTQRTQARNVSLDDAKNMAKQIEYEVRQSKIQYIEFLLG